MAPQRFSHDSTTGNVSVVLESLQNHNYRATLILRKNLRGAFGGESVWIAIEDDAHVVDRYVAYVTGTSHSFYYYLQDKKNNESKESRRLPFFT